MARGTFLSDEERSTIIKGLAAGDSPVEIAKKLARDPRTVKRFIADPSKKYVRPKGPYQASVTTRERTRLKRAINKNHLSTSKKIFEEAGVQMKGKTTRCRVVAGSLLYSPDVIKLR